jgi:hypothetical protein
MNETNDSRRLQLEQSASRRRYGEGRIMCTTINATPRREKEH